MLWRPAGGRRDAMTTMPMTKTKKDCNKTGRRKNFERIIPLSDDYIGEGMSNITDSKGLHDSSRDIYRKKLKMISRDERIAIDL